MERPGGQGAPSVFVSYAREDEAFVQRLCAALARRNHQAWIDQIDLHPFDPDWTASVRSAIEARATFLVVISPQSVASEPCAAELAHAVAHNKGLAPIPIYVWESSWLDECPAHKERARDAKRADASLPWRLEQSTLEGDALVGEICRRLPRNLTREEWISAFGDEPYRATCPNLPPETQ